MYLINNQIGDENYTNLRIAASNNTLLNNYLEDRCNFWDSLNFYADLSNQDNGTTVSTTVSTNVITTVSSTDSSEVDDGNNAQTVNISLAVIMFSLFLSLFA